MTEEWILDCLGEKAYFAYWKSGNADEHPDSWKSLSDNTRRAWMAVVNEILISYPTIGEIDCGDLRE